MSPAPHAASDPSLELLVGEWLAGFCLTRGVAQHRRGEVVEVEVAAESRRLELVVVEPDDALLAATAARLVGTSDVWMSILGRVPRELRPPDGVIEHQHGEALMTTDLTSPGALPTQVRLEPDGDRATARILVDGEQAAQGVVGVIGASATFDRIGTDPQFQRRGLGRSVVLALTDWAVERGATRGVLAASVEGQHLYRALGWDVVASLQTLRGA